MKSTSSGWNSDLNHASFFLEEVEAILAIPSSSRQDALCWHFDIFEKFSIKSAYWLASQDLDSPSSSSSS
ncbi:hypothetical protein ACOSP7_004583 [Xanthoceras sorbifolium]